jgi:hypothetical protein
MRGAFTCCSNDGGRCCVRHELQEGGPGRARSLRIGDIGLRHVLLPWPAKEMDLRCYRAQCASSAGQDAPGPPSSLRSAFIGCASKNARQNRKFAPPALLRRGPVSLRRGKAVRVARPCGRARFQSARTSLPACARHSPGAGSLGCALERRSSCTRNRADAALGSKMATQKIQWSSK